MSKLQELIEWYPDEKLLSANGFEDAILGVIHNKFTSTYNIVYSKSKCIEILITRDKMRKEEAEEFFDYNVEGSYMGEKTPIWVDDMMFY
jgi:hypothetical protein